MTNIDGVYRVDILGTFGWESFSTAFIDGGAFRSASAEHFTEGTCSVADGGFQMEGSLTQFDDNRVLFGRKNLKGLPIKFRGEIHDDVIDGVAKLTHGGRHSLRFRLARLSALN